MIAIPDDEIRARMRFDNPWWPPESKKATRLELRRAYFLPFHKLVAETNVRRAVILMGPRRVGKSVLMWQLIDQLIADGVDPKTILYVSIDNPVYLGIPLDKLVRFFDGMHGHERDTKRFVLFDEVQYLEDWEVHVKSLVDSFPSIKFVASGSAAAALKRKSQESGAGRFTDFLLPPLSFFEFCNFKNVDTKKYDVTVMNSHFIDYVNFGGFPESVLNAEVRADPQRFIGNDIIDKVLQRDLPAIYGIADPRELYRFFRTVTYNTGREVNVDSLSNESNVAKQTINRFLEYLEATYLIHRLYKVDAKANHFKKITTFKCYLTNPSLRAALFGPIREDDPGFGYLAETAYLSQWLHTGAMPSIYYARWPDKEIDFVFMNRILQKPAYAVEVKWSQNQSELERAKRTLIAFCKDNGISQARLLTKDTTEGVGGESVQFGALPLTISMLLENKLHAFAGEEFGFNPAQSY